MRKQWIRLLSLILCMSMLLSMGPAVYAAETEPTAAETTESTVPETTAETEPETTAAPATEAEETEAEETEAEETETVPETTAETEAEETAPETTAVTEPEETAPETTAETVPETTAATVPETTAETEPEESAALEAALAAAKEFLDTYFPEGNYSDTIAAMAAEQREACYAALQNVADIYDILEDEEDIAAFDEAYAEILDEINTALSEPETAVRKASTTADVLSMLAELKSKFDGKYWNYYDFRTWGESTSEAKVKSLVDNGSIWKTSPTNAELGVTTTSCAGSSVRGKTCGSNKFSGGWQCYGFAWFIEYVLFQSTPYYNGYSDWQVYNSSNCNLYNLTLQPGDYIGPAEKLRYLRKS